MILIFDWKFREASSAHIFVVDFIEELFVAGSVCNSRQTQDMNDKGAERYKRSSALGFKVQGVQTKFFPFFSPQDLKENRILFAIHDSTPKSMVVGGCWIGSKLDQSK